MPYSNGENVKQRMVASFVNPGENYTLFMTLIVLALPQPPLWFGEVFVVRGSKFPPPMGEG